ncbi:MAG: YfbM family protein [Myxococcota bacterium]
MGMIGNLLRVSDANLNAFKADSTKLEDTIHRARADESPELIDIDKTWDGIVFLLTGQSAQSTSHELSRVIFSGALVDEAQDLGMGPAHYLTPDEVRSLHDTIKNISTETLQERFDPQKMTELEVYPQIWDEGDEAFDYLKSNFLALIEFYGSAVREQQAIITFVN